MRTALYRHFDAEGRLLYVGISLSAARRLEQHKSTAQWFSKIVRVEIQWHPSRMDALAAEASAIVNEHPLHNVWRPTQKRAASPMQEACTARAGEGVMHLKTGRIDGWYFDGSGEHMLGWFRCVFPRDEFKLIEARKGADNLLTSGRALRWTEHDKWAMSPPDLSAGDLFDRMAA